MINGYNPAEFVNRKINFLLKNLPAVVCDNIYKRLNQLDVYDIKCLSEREEDYPTFRSLEYDDDLIRTVEEESAEKFANINEYLAENERFPFFTDPQDTCTSAKEYIDLLQERPYQELVDFFGATYEDYVPKVLKKTNEKDSPSKD